MGGEWKGYGRGMGRAWEVVERYSGEESEGTEER